MAISQSEFLRSDGMVRAPGGAPFRVSPLHTDRFNALLADLERAGVRIDPSQSGGFANRNIAGTSVPSQHSFGRAVDVNWRDNPRGPMASPPPLPYDMYGEDARQPTTSIHPEIARDLAQRHGFTWGGDWSNPDPMHFEVARGNLPPVPVQQRSFTAFAGAQPPQPPAPQPQPPPVSPPTHSSTAQPNVGPWQTSVQPEPQGNAFGDALGKALANMPEMQAPQVNPTAMGLLSSPPPMPMASSGWVSNPFQQRRAPGLQRFTGQFGMT
jgi:hypothetical protein